MYSNFKEHLQSTINGIREAGLYKNERVIEGPQDARIRDKIGTSCKL
jgi:glycine C-acetyltransferase